MNAVKDNENAIMAEIMSIYGWFMVEFGRSSEQVKVEIEKWENNRSPRLRFSIAKSKCSAFLDICPSECTMDYIGRVRVVPYYGDNAYKPILEQVFKELDPAPMMRVLKEKVAEYDKYEGNLVEF